MRLAALWAISIISTARGFMVSQPLTRATLATGIDKQGKHDFSCTRELGYGVGLRDQDRRLPGRALLMGMSPRITPTRTIGPKSKCLVGATSWGPEPGRTWAAEAVLAASLRQVEAGGGRRQQTEARREDDITAWKVAEVGGEWKEGEGSFTKLLASNLLRLVRVTAVDKDGEKGTCVLEGLLTEVQEGTRACPMSGAGRSQRAFFSIRNANGALVTIPVADALELQVGTVEGSADKATREHLHRAAAGAAYSHVSRGALDNDQLTLLRGMSASLGRKVLVQNLRHVMVGVASFRAPWTDLLSSDAVEGLAGKEKGAWPLGTCPSRAHPLRGWLVKVLPVQRTYQEGQSGGEQWVGVEEVLPMSEYDLEAYATYRHETLPSSEYDLQRHDPALQSRYRKAARREDEGLFGVGAATVGEDSTSAAGGSRLRDAYAVYSEADLALVG